MDITELRHAVVTDLKNFPGSFDTSGFDMRLLGNGAPSRGGRGRGRGRRNPAVGRGASLVHQQPHPHERHQPQKEALVAQPSAGMGAQHGRTLGARPAAAAATLQAHHAHPSHTMAVPIHSSAGHVSVPYGAFVPRLPPFSNHISVYMR